MDGTELVNIKNTTILSIQDIDNFGSFYSKKQYPKSPTG